MIFNLDINIDFNAVDGKNKYKATEIQNIIAEYIEAKSVYRILDLNGLFITSLVDRYYQTGGKVERYEDTSDWDGRDHLGQIVPPGTYLIHLEASNFQTGKTTIDVAPVVIGVKNK